MIGEGSGGGIMAVAVGTGDHSTTSIGTANSVGNPSSSKTGSTDPLTLDNGDGVKGIVEGGSVHPREKHGDVYSSEDGGVSLIQDPAGVEPVDSPAFAGTVTNKSSVEIDSINITMHTRTDSAFTIGSVSAIDMEDNGIDFLRSAREMRRPSFHLASDSFEAPLEGGHESINGDSSTAAHRNSIRSSSREVLQLRSFSEDMLSSNVGEVSDKDSAAIMNEVKIELSRSRSATAPSMKNILAAEEAIMKPDKGSPADLALSALQPPDRKNSDSHVTTAPTEKKHRRNSSTDKVRI